MPRSSKSDSRREIHLSKRDVSAGDLRRAKGNIARLDRLRNARHAAATKALAGVRRDYLKELTSLVGIRGIRELSEIRAGRQLMRSQKIRRSIAVLETTGLTREHIRVLSHPFLVRSRDILADATQATEYELLHDGPCESPWVTYQPPFSGYVWSYNWHRSSGPANPVLARYLDTATGRIGSSIQVKDPDAGDDDDLSVDYYTGLNVWHTPLSTGPLEVYLVFKYVSSKYSGKIRDEFGFSDITYTQGAFARLLATDAVNPVQTEEQESSMYGFTDFIWGGDRDWDLEGARPRDLHSYFFRTGASFERGSTVLLEGGIHHMSWFRTNDESITMSSDVDLRLDSIMVRSCRDVFL